MHVSDCFRAKIDACVKRTLETKPQLIQISAAWNSARALLGTESICGVGDQETQAERHQHQGLSVQKPCDKMTEAIVMDGANADRSSGLRDPACRTHHPTRLLRSKSSGSGQRNGSASKRRNWPLRLAIVSWPRSPTRVGSLKKADLLTVGHYLIGHLSTAKFGSGERHK